MRRLFAAAAILLVSATKAQAYTFTDWVKTRVYYGCTTVESGGAGSCHRLTLQYGPIGPEPVIYGLEMGMRYQIENWYFRTGGTPWPLRSLIASSTHYFIGPELSWEDAGSSDWCHMPYCNGYNADDGYWYWGPLPLWDGWEPKDTYEFRTEYLLGEGPTVTPFYTATLRLVPEPSTYAMLATGLLALAWLRRRTTTEVRADRGRHQSR